MNETSPTRYIPINRDQQVLQPLDIERLIAADHAARKIWAVVTGLDLSRFEEQIAGREGGAGWPCRPARLLVSVLVCCYQQGV